MAVPLTGTAYGTIAAGGTTWYSYYHQPTLNDEVILKATTTVAVTTGKIASTGHSGSHAPQSMHAPGSM